MVIENRSQLQDVAADRIADFDAGGCAGEFPRIARVLEMIEESVTEHMRKYLVASDRCPATSENDECAGMPAQQCYSGDMDNRWCEAQLKRVATICPLRLSLQYGRARR